MVEDDKSIIAALTAFLLSEGYEICTADGQKGALDILSRSQFDLVLLDVSLKDGNGFSLCRAIKSEYGTPIIFLTASGDEYSTVTGFEVGADDYIIKPFRPRELASRIKNVLRLTKGAGSRISLGDVVIDTEKGTAQKDSRELYLSALEYRLLLIFATNRGRVLSRSFLLQSIWDAAGEFVSDNTLTVYIKRLREKVESDPQAPTLIKTVRGMGYRVD